MLWNEFVKLSRISKLPLNEQVRKFNEFTLDKEQNTINYQGAGIEYVTLNFSISGGDFPTVDFILYQNNNMILKYNYNQFITIPASNRFIRIPTYSKVIIACSDFDAPNFDSGFSLLRNNTTIINQQGFIQGVEYSFIPTPASTFTINFFATST
jgi:hypothetical protein